VPIVALIALTLTLGRWRWWAVSYSIQVSLIAVTLVLLLGALWRWLDHPLARYLGALSYSVYLYHMLAWYLAQRVTHDPLGSGLLAVVLTFPLAALSYHLIERPILAWRDRRLPSQTAMGRPT
jgi:peptidoglycan/LPS O-acetylase OafA/YrhL